MAKHKTREEWISLFKEFERTRVIPKKYFDELTLKDSEISKAKRKSNRSPKLKITQSRIRFKYKYNEWKLLDNKFMNKKQKRGKKPKRDIEGFVRNLTREQLEEIARIHIEQNEKKKDKSTTYSRLSKRETAFVLNIHRTTLYKQSKERIYKFDIYKQEIIDSFNEMRGMFGRRRLSILLKSKGIFIDERTLGRYLLRYGLKTKTRVAKRKREIKVTKTKFDDLVKRNFNPQNDNIIASDVSYIPANEEQNNVYLSIAISHKTKAIESYSLSKINDNQLVLDTLNTMKRKNFIFHTDHGHQYSSWDILTKLNDMNGTTSMSRVGNSLDNREAEYFFGCLKGEYLNHINTRKMKIDEIRNHIDWYIKWYNRNRIQKRLQWKTPTEVSAYAI